MPRIDGDELGRRIFLIEKEKAVESAIEKMRHTLGGDWDLFREGDYEALKEVLGEAWTSIERPRWKAFQFSRLTRARRHITDDTLRAVEAVLQSSSGETRKR
jgi:hypothetical protein